MLKYDRVEQLVENMLLAKINVHACVKDFLKNVFAQKILATSERYTGWTQYDSLILGNLSPRSIQEFTFHQIHTVLLNDTDERTLLWVARVNQELMQNLYTAINMSAFTGFQVLSTRILGRDIISPHFKTLDEAVSRAAETIVDNFFTLHSPYPISRKEQYDRSQSLYIDSSYANSMNSLFDANFVRVAHEWGFKWNPLQYKFSGNFDDELGDLNLSAVPLDEHHSGFTLTIHQWTEMKIHLAFCFSENNLYDRDVCTYIVSFVLSPISPDYVW